MESRLWTYPQSRITIIELINQRYKIKKISNIEKFDNYSNDEGNPLKIKVIRINGVL